MTTAAEEREPVDDVEVFLAVDGQPFCCINLMLPSAQPKSCTSGTVGTIDVKSRSAG
jgi:hypothetical protein